MTSTNKFTWGIILTIFGSLLASGGLVLTLTVIGACVGIPMGLLGLPMVIWGLVWILQGRTQKQQEAITAGIKEGLKAGQESSRKTD